MPRDQARRQLCVHDSALGPGTYPNIKQAYIPNFAPVSSPQFKSFVASAVGNSKVRPVFRIEGIDRPIDSNVSDNIATDAVYAHCNVSKCLYNGTTQRTTGLCFAGIVSEPPDFSLTASVSPG